MLYHDTPRLTVLRKHIEGAKRLRDLAIDETHTYAGWEVERLSQRLMIGYTAEVFVADWMQRQIKAFVHHPDPSGPQGDPYDLEVAGILIDVKTTCTDDLPPRVNASRTNSTKVDWYIFTRLDVRLRWIQLLGVATMTEVKTRENHVPHNGRIPGTSKTEFFRHGSYYMRELSPMERLIRELKHVE